MSWKKNGAKERPGEGTLICPERPESSPTLSLSPTSSKDGSGLEAQVSSRGRKGDSIPGSAIYVSDPCHSRTHKQKDTEILGYQSSGKIRMWVGCGIKIITQNNTPNTRQ